MNISIIMYHYVRDLSRSRFPSIKGRSLDEFKGQLDYIETHHTVVTVDQVVAAIHHKEKLPDNAIWLTFDDGYLDHFTNVFPLLYERGWQGSFFPPSRTVLDREVLDVNKIHFILAAQPDSEKIISEIKIFLEEVSNKDGVLQFAAYWENLAIASRYDPAEIVFIKRLLQHALPEDLRNTLTMQLFCKFVSTDTTAFAEELYMSADQLKMMARCGMYIGSHGAKHYWMDRLTPTQQLAEIDESLDFLRLIGAPVNNWIMCYPFGAHNEAIYASLEKRHCAAAITTRVSVAKIGSDPHFELPRLDTNDLPV